MDTSNFLQTTKAFISNARELCQELEGLLISVFLLIALAHRIWTSITNHWR